MTYRQRGAMLSPVLQAQQCEIGAGIASATRADTLVSDEITTLISSSRRNAWLAVITVSLLNTIPLEACLLPWIATTLWPPWLMLPQVGR